MTIDSSPSDHPGRPSRRAVSAMAMACVAALTIAACSSGTTDGPMAASTNTPTGSATPPATANPVDVTNVTSGTQARIGHFDDVSVSVTVPDGWTNSSWAVIKGDPAFGLVFAEVGNIYTDSCPSVELDPPVGPTVDDLAAAWSGLLALNATAPTDITVDGFDGKLVEFTVPDYDENDCAYGEFMLLRNPNGPDGYWAQAPNQHHQVRILDVDGTRVVIAASWYPDTSAQDRADIDEILNSVQLA